MRFQPLHLATVVLTLVACGEQTAPNASPSHAAPIKAADPTGPEFKQRFQARLDEMAKEESVIEIATWFGKTGLPEGDERELPRYLRREFGKLLAEPGSLKASDLEYLGVFNQAGESVHYWRINYGSPEAKFAYVVTAPPGHEQMGWGDRRPPQ